MVNGDHKCNETGEKILNLGCVQVLLFHTRLLDIVYMRAGEHKAAGYIFDPILNESARDPSSADG